MRKIGIAKFREQCLALLDRLDADGLIVTRHGKPVARVVPYDRQHDDRQHDDRQHDDRQCADLIGSLRHKIRIRGDILTTGLGPRRTDGPGPNPPKTGRPAETSEERKA